MICLFCLSLHPIYILQPTANPSQSPSRSPSKEPSVSPSANPTKVPTGSPSKQVSQHICYAQDQLFMRVILREDTVCLISYGISCFLSSLQPSSSPTVGPTSSPTREVSSFFYACMDSLRIAYFHSRHLKHELIFTLLSLHHSSNSHLRVHLSLHHLVQQRCQRDRHQSR